MKLKKLSIICATLACFVFTSTLFAQQQPSFIRKVANGLGVHELIQLKEGGYAYLSGNNVTVVKDPLGNSVSEIALTFIGLPCTERGCGLALEGFAQTVNGFVLVGWYREGGYYSNAGRILLTLSREGRVLWAKTIGAGYFQSVIATSDGGFIVASHPFRLTKFDPLGGVQWSKSFGVDSFFLARRTLDGGVIVAGDVQYDGKIDVIKINGFGTVIWAITLEIKEFSLQSLTSLSNGSYALAGKATNPNRLLLVTLNGDGTLHSNASYSLAVPDYFVTSVAQTSDNGIAITGELLKKTGSLNNAFFLKINDRQELTVTKRLGVPNSSNWFASVVPKNDGSYLLFGSSYGASNDALFAGLNSAGLAPGCAFSQTLSARRVLFENISLTKLTITPKKRSLPAGTLRTVTSKVLNHEISNACAN
jgi:hypothetical protein